MRTSHDELIDGFDIGRFSSAPTKFNVEDLVPLSHRVIASLDSSAVDPQLEEAGVPTSLRPAYWNAVRGNVASRAEAGSWWRVFSEGARPAVPEEDRAFVDEALGHLGDPPYDDTTWSTWTASVKEATGRKGKALFMPLRLAVTGEPRGPEMAEVMPLLQRKPSLG